jgi:hypothetical protein
MLTAGLRQEDEELNVLLKARGDLKGPAGSIDRELTKLLAEHRARLIKWGAAGQLAIDGVAAAVIALGAAHDLSGSVQKLGDASTECVRVTTKTVERFAGRGSP